MSELQLQSSEEEYDGIQDQELVSLGSRLSAVFTEYKDSRRDTETHGSKTSVNTRGNMKPMSLRD